MFPSITSSSPTPSPSLERSPTGSSASTRQLLSQVKAHYDTKKEAAEQARLEKLEADRQLQRQLEAQRQQEQQAKQERLQQQKEAAKAARLKRAEAWLAALEPNSDEGFWFESFSLNYGSKLDAALEYLDALDESAS